MAYAYSRGDTLGIYHTKTGVDEQDLGLGGRKDALEYTLGFHVNQYQIPPLVILALSGNNTAEAVLSAKSASTLAFTGTSGTEGSESSCAARDSVLLEDTDTSKWCRVYRDTDYSAADLGGFFNLECFPQIHSVVGGDIVTVSGSVQNYYSSLMLSNHSSQGEAVTLLKAYIGTLGTQRLSGTTQLGGAGSGTIKTATTDGFDDWPLSGWCRITTNAPALREIVYYSSRTSDTLTVPADGRGRLGTAAAAGAATDSVDAVPGIRIGYESMDSNGEIQTIANHATAPTGITWDTDITEALGLSIGTLNPRENAGLWIHREIPANVSASILMENKIVLSYTVGAIAYTNQIRGDYRIKDPNLALVSLWLGVDADPDLTLAPDDTAAFFPSVIITPPVSGVSEYRITCRRTNEYGLTSWDNDYKSIWVNAAGTQVDKPVNSPTDISLANRGGGVAVLQAKYQPMMDSPDPADYFYIYMTTNGVDPDPAVDVAYDTVAFTDSTLVKISQFDSSYVILYAFPTQAYNTDMRVVITAYRSADLTQSNNTAVSQVTIDTVSATLSILPQVASMMGTQLSNTTPDAQILTAALGSTWGYSMYVGEFLLYTGTTVVMRSTIKENNQGRIYIPASFVFNNTAHSAAAAVSTQLIEGVDANTAYILVGTTRRAKIDLVAGTIEAAEMNWGIGITEDIPVNAYAWGDSTATYLLQYSPVRGRFVPWLKLTSAGVLTTTAAVTQRRS
jgi:hypothetical protein